MDANYISTTQDGAERSGTTLLVRSRAGTLVTETERSVDETKEVRGKWTITEVIQSPPLPVNSDTVIWLGDHPSISDFVQKAVKIEGVRCIVVEDIEGQIIHFTTFADPMTENLRQAVYMLEAETIDSHPDLTFDFHLRVASETHTGTPIPIPGQKFFAVWGGLDENPE